MDKPYLKNDQISATKVHLIDETGENLGIVTIEEALLRAEEADLDLVELPSQQYPPICKIMNFGSFLYHEQKKKTANQKHVSAIKDLQLGLRIGKKDLDTKAQQARQFLARGDKVKLTLQFKGRELQHLDQGLTVFTTFLELVTDVGYFDKEPVLNRNKMSALLLALKPVAKKH